MVKPSLAPWLSVSDGVRAIEFYKAAFGATEVYHLDDPGGGVVSRLAIDGGEFWISGEQSHDKRGNEATVAAPKVRMIWAVTDPDTVFARALGAGATEVFPVSEEYGWRVGRLMDPFGNHWEIGHQVE